MNATGFKNSYSELQAFSFNYSLDSQTYILGDLLRQWFFAFTDDAHYNKMLAGINFFLAEKGICGSKKGATDNDKPRILITLADGTVALDTTMTNNTFDDYKTKTINENHNSRVAIMSALLNSAGVAFEVKYSTSSGNIEHYMAVRVGGVSAESAGIVRLSYVGSNTLL